MQRLLVQDGRDAEAGLLDQELLDGVGEFGGFARIALLARSSDLTNPARHQLTRLRRREQARLLVVQPSAKPVDPLELRDFFRRCHAAEQVGHAGVDCESLASR